MQYAYYNMDKFWLEISFPTRYATNYKIRKIVRPHKMTQLIS